MDVCDNIAPFITMFFFIELIFLQFTFMSLRLYFFRNNIFLGFLEGILAVLFILIFKIYPKCEYFI